MAWNLLVYFSAPLMTGVEFYLTSAVADVFLLSTAGVSSI